VYDEHERSLLLTRFHDKRQVRNWSKKTKIRYDCRKNLADRRVRVKGRFVSNHQQSPTKDNHEPLATTRPTTTSVVVPVVITTMLPDVNDPDAGFCPTADQPYRRLRRHTLT
jgi:CCT motif